MLLFIDICLFFFYKAACSLVFWLQINHVGPVPPSYYVRQHVKVDYEQCMVVKRGSSQQLDYEILFPGCVLRSDT